MYYRFIQIANHIEKLGTIPPECVIDMRRGPLKYIGVHMLEQKKNKNKNKTNKQKTRKRGSFFSMTRKTRFVF